MKKVFYLLAVLLLVGTGFFVQSQVIIRNCPDGYVCGPDFSCYLLIPDDWTLGEKYDYGPFRCNNGGLHETYAYCSCRCQGGHGLVDACTTYGNATTCEVGHCIINN